MNAIKRIGAHLRMGPSPWFNVSTSIIYTHTGEGVTDEMRGRGPAPYLRSNTLCPPYAPTPTLLLARFS